ncbi:unnamed protein product [Caenorhabditis nigoni]
MDTIIRKSRPLRQCLGFSFSVGQVASTLRDVFGCRQVFLAEPGIDAAGILLSIPEPNIYKLYLTYGRIAGAGFGNLNCCVWIWNRNISVRHAERCGLGVCEGKLATIASRRHRRRENLWICFCSPSSYKAQNGVHHNGSVKNNMKAVVKDVEKLNLSSARMDVFYTRSKSNIAVRSRYEPRRSCR